MKLRHVYFQNARIYYTKRERAEMRCGCCVRRRFRERKPVPSRPSLVSQPAHAHRFQWTSGLSAVVRRAVYPANVQLINLWSRPKIAAVQLSAGLWQGYRDPGPTGSSQPSLLLSPLSSLSVEKRGAVFLLRRAAATGERFKKRFSFKRAESKVENTLEIWRRVPLNKEKEKKNWRIRPQMLFRKEICKRDRNAAQKQHGATKLPRPLM